MGHTSEFYFSQTLGRPLDDCGWKDIHETSFSLIKNLVGKKNAVLADSFECDCKRNQPLRSTGTIYTDKTPVRVIEMIARVMLNVWLSCNLDMELRDCRMAKLVA